MFVVVIEVSDGELPSLEIEVFDVLHIVRQSVHEFGDHSR